MTSGQKKSLEDVPSEGMHARLNFHQMTIHLNWHNATYSQSDCKSAGNHQENLATTYNILATTLDILATPIQPPWTPWQPARTHLVTTQNK